MKVYYGESTSLAASEVSTSTLEATYSVELGGLSDDTKYYFKLNTFDMEDAEYEGTILILPRCLDREFPMSEFNR